MAGGWKREARRFLLLGGVALALGGCASDDSDELMPDKPVEELYNDAADLMQEQSWHEAARGFEEVERQHPYSQWATRAQLMAAYAQYQAMDYEAAVASLDRFIQIHPGSAQAPYAWYLRALCWYERLADVRRDQSFAEEALKGLREIVSRFPDTPYARDAALKIALVNDHLAGAEMEVGRHYLRQNVYTAALGRFRLVVEKYQTTSHVPEALHRIVECSLALGLGDEAKAAAAVLGHNFPGSPWYQDSYALMTRDGQTPGDDNGTWIGRVWKKAF